MHQGFYGVGCLCSGKLLLIGFLSLDDRNSQHLLTEVCIYIQHLDGSCLGFLGRCMGCMAFLPQKLPGTQEGTGCFLPAHNRTPLVVYPWQIAVGMDILCVKITEQGLRGRPYAHTLLKFLQSSVGHPCHLRRKSLHMVLFLLQQTLRYKDGHVYVLHPCLLKPSVHLLLDVFPDCVAGRLNHHASLDAGIIAKLRLLYHIRIPLGEILIHGCDGLYHFLVVCHDSSPFRYLH